MCVALEDYMCPMYKIINLNIIMLHYVLVHDITPYTISLLLRIHVNY